MKSPYPDRSALDVIRRDPGARTKRTPLAKHIDEVLSYAGPRRQHALTIFETISEVAKRIYWDLIVLYDRALELGEEVAVLILAAWQQTGCLTVRGGPYHWWPRMALGWLMRAKGEVLPKLPPRRGFFKEELLELGPGYQADIRQMIIEAHKVYRYAWRVECVVHTDQDFYEVMFITCRKERPLTWAPVEPVGLSAPDSNLDWVESILRNVVTPLSKADAATVDGIRGILSSLPVRAVEVYDTVAGRLDIGLSLLRAMDRDVVVGQTLELLEDRVPFGVTINIYIRDGSHTELAYSSVDQ